MKFSKRAAAFAAFLAMPVLLYVAACAQSAAALPTYSYNGPGSKWAVTLNTDGTFTITHAPDTVSAVDLTVNGTFTRLSTGFVHLTVTSATGTDAPSAGDEAYGLEVPGFAFLLKPAGSDSQVIPMVASGTCPTEDMAANWIIMEKGNSSSAASSTQDWFGTFTYAAATGIATVATKFALTASFPAVGSASAMPGTTCSNGIMNPAADVDMFLTSGDGAIVHTNTDDEADDSFIVAFPTEELSSLANLDGTYAGVVFNKDVAEGSPDRINPIRVTMTSSSANAGTAVGNKYSDVETGTVTGDTATLTFNTVDSPSNGFITGTITIASASGNIVCTANKNVAGSGKKAMFCIGQSPSDTTQQFNFLAVSN